MLMKTEYVDPNYSPNVEALRLADLHLAAQREKMKICEDERAEQNRHIAALAEFKKRKLALMEMCPHLKKTNHIGCAYQSGYTDCDLCEKEF